MYHLFILNLFDGKKVDLILKWVITFMQILKLSTIKRIKYLENVIVLE